MEPALFKKFCEITYEKSGITLKPGKEALVEARVSKRRRALQIEDVGEYLSYLENDKSGEELVFFLDAISTNFTHFFREKEHFEMLAAEAERWVARGDRDVRVWCAASSTGEEPYTIVMTLQEAIGGGECAFKLLATDISTRVLERASAGVYSAEQVSTIPRSLLLKYFTKYAESRTAEPTYRVVEALRRRILFKRLNLSTPPFPMHGPLHAVFCRNVMIYFDQSVRQRLIQDIERLLMPGGVLFIGHSETLTGIECGFKLERPSVYRKAVA